MGSLCHKLRIYSSKVLFNVQYMSRELGSYWLVVTIPHRYATMEVLTIYPLLGQNPTERHFCAFQWAACVINLEYIHPKSCLMFNPCLGSWGLIGWLSRSRIDMLRWRS